MEKNLQGLRSRNYEMQMQNPSTENRRPGRCVVGWGVKRGDQCFCHAGGRCRQCLRGASATAATRREPRHGTNDQPYSERTRTGAMMVDRTGVVCRMLERGIKSTMVDFCSSFFVGRALGVPWRPERRCPVRCPSQVKN